MSELDLRARLEECDLAQKMVLAMLALAGEPVGKKRLREYLAPLFDASFTEEALTEDLAMFRARGLVTDVTGRGSLISPAAAWPALEAALDNDALEKLFWAYLRVNPLAIEANGRPILRSYRQGIAILRAELLSGDAERVPPILAACLLCYDATTLHPLIDICARPFEPRMIDRIHPDLRARVLAELVSHAQHEPAIAAQVRACAEQHIARGTTSMALRAALAEHYLLCGRLTDAAALLEELDHSARLLLDSALKLMRDEVDAALAGFEQAIKALRRETGKRKAVFNGFGAFLYVTALLRSKIAKHQQMAETYLEAALRPTGASPVFYQLSMFRTIQGGTTDVEVLPSRTWETALQPVMFRSLLHYWLGLPQLDKQRARIEEALAQSEQAGFDFISAQLAAILGGLGAVGHEQRAGELRRLHRITDMTLWFEREEPWERQLNALINLQPAVNKEVVKESRLVWQIAFDPRYGVTELEPREQKRDAKGGWSRGRVMGLKRLYEDGAVIDFLTAQDLQAATAIETYSRYYSGGISYELNIDKALHALVGHPLLFLSDAPGTRIELLPGEPELLVKANGDKVTITLQPLPGQRSDSTVVRETPTRLRLVRINDEHRRIAAILGDGLTVPLSAERRVLDAISAISTMVTVQSDIGSSAADIEQVEADSRLHVHLLPYQQGLRMQVLVRPLPDAGAYYQPGSGAERVIGEVNGVRLEARRNLNGEREAERELAGACHALEHAEQEHGEWLLGQPLQCLELVAELQALDPAKVVVAWPDGEPFRVSRRVESSSVRLTIKRDKDWFALDGEVRIDENRVMNLRTLLERLRESEGRFVALGENQFLALSNELHRRLTELLAYGEQAGDAVRVHPLASFALEELAHDAGGVKADKAWREHLARMKASTDYEPQLPSTLQAELRDYQREGFEWLARLAHWGVGACLADDMGLGKTLQALALILSRAPNGPTLVVAPTSVCMNWIAESARFAPTLNVKLFGPGDRAAMLDNLQPFDLVIASYGLLQLEAPLFAKPRWHTIVLDEAQAIKNAHTRRSQAVMALQGDFRMVATGTPLENHLGELWNLFRFINPGLLGTSDQFNLRFAGPIERAQDKRAESAARARLRRLTQPFILRRTKAQVLSELPPRTEITVPVELTQEETALYESLRREALDKLAALEAPQNQKAIQILAEMMKLRRACCNPELVAPGLNIASSKLATFAHLLAGLLENRHKVLVFSQFVDHLALIRKHLDERGIRYQYLDGATPMQERKKRVEAFQAGDGDVFLISLKAGGVGINLTAADYVIHMDPWWNPAVEDQASDRAHRMGQQRPVTIYRLVAQHTIEEGIVELHGHKRDLADSLLEGSDLAARMSPEDMLMMLQQGLAR
ncbi:DEAD/DEAH box helicase [Massilia horti]|uniref:DEAD/DEAH box helicase n=1 Tax=Massilia horti TaxID=2562153 RepID=A0A4Y9SP41_9BURK|nr:DEAD/DEAH box helicase [Massilia horti]TFW28271.1 DEAD/DEAH box helicase [Massilia horti]